MRNSRTRLSRFRFMAHWLQGGVCSVCEIGVSSLAGLLLCLMKAMMVPVQFPTMATMIVNLSCGPISDQTHPAMLATMQVQSELMEKRQNQNIDIRASNAARLVFEISCFILFSLLASSLF